MKLALLAFPRTGSTLVRMLISYILKTAPNQPQKKMGHLDRIVDYELTNTEIDFRKFHWPKEFNTYSFNPNYLIGLFRDPIETTISLAILNGARYNNPADINSIAIANIKKLSNEYIQNMDYYKNFKENKFIIIYENIIDDFDNEMKRIAKCFDVEISEDDIQKLHDIKKVCLKLKQDITHDRCPTEGKDVKFYSKVLTQNKRNEFKEATRRAYQVLNGLMVL